MLTTNRILLIHLPLHMNQNLSTKLIAVDGDQDNLSNIYAIIDCDS